MIDVVGGLTFGRHDSLDADFAEFRPRPLEASVVVREDELHTRAPEGVARGRASEDQLAHRGRATQFRDARLAEHPANGVDDVRLAAAVGSDDPDDGMLELDERRIGKALEACELDLT